MIIRKCAQAFFLSALLISTGCASEKILTNSPDFTAVAGRKYVILKECYIYRDVGEHPKYPVVAFYSETPGVGTPSFPKNAQNFVDKRVDGVEILGILPKGTSFTAVTLRQVSTFENTLTSFDISPDGDLGRKWPILDGLWLTNDRTKPISFYSEIVGEVGNK
jgi:hypothetical protein